jgi:hypothetical protein
LFLAHHKDIWEGHSGTVLCSSRQCDSSQARNCPEECNKLEHRASLAYLLGWLHSRVKKGIYMDGHERKDVAVYRDTVFLPLMNQYEARMVHYDKDSSATFPTLEDTDKRLIAQFHDECCFHANDESSHTW